jgi:hypothetical protein
MVFETFLTHFNGHAPLHRLIGSTWQVGSTWQAAAPLSRPNSVPASVNEDLARLALKRQ